MSNQPFPTPAPFSGPVADDTPIIIDIGESTCKVGFAGEEMPRSIFPTIVGREKYTAVMVDATRKQAYVGEEANRSRGVLKIGYPISRGNIMVWEDFFEVITYIYYNVLRIDPSQHPVIYVEHMLTPPETREYLARLFFDTYKVPALFMAPSTVFAMFAVGLTNAFVVESGEGVTFLVPIFGGEPFYPGVTKLNLAGADVAEHLKGLLLRLGHSLQSSAQKEIARDIKEKNCYIALDPEEERKKIDPQDINTYDLPDGETINIDPETRFYAAEILFNPSILGYNCESIPQAIINSLIRLDPYWRWELLKNIVLSGGNCNFQGFDLRLEKELEKLLYSLGPMPEPQPPVEIAKPKKILVDAIKSLKVVDTCPNCGNPVNPSEDKFCPNCAFQLEVTQISIGPMLGTPVEPKPMTKCPKCKRTLTEVSDVFCPFCGFDLEKERKKTAAKIGPINLSPPKEMARENLLRSQGKMGDNSEFSDVEEFNEEKTNSSIKFHALPDRIITAFIGASILGSLTNFRQIIVTGEEFRVNPSAINRTISQLFNQ